MIFKQIEEKKYCRIRHGTNYKEEPWHEGDQSVVDLQLPTGVRGAISADDKFGEVRIIFD